MDRSGHMMSLLAESVASCSVGRSLSAEVCNTGKKQEELEMCVAAGL